MLLLQRDWSLEVELPQVFGVVPLPVTIPFAVEALGFSRSSFGFLHGSGNLLVILLEVPFLFLCPFS